jgi:hypothetical protein
MKGLLYETMVEAAGYIPESVIVCNVLNDII